MKMCCNHIGVNSSTHSCKCSIIEYIEVPGEATWWHRMQENPSSAGVPPRTPLRELTALPRPSKTEHYSPAVGWDILYVKYLFIRPWCSLFYSIRIRVSET